MEWAVGRLLREVSCCFNAIVFLPLGEEDQNRKLVAVSDFSNCLLQGKTFGRGLAIPVLKEVENTPDVEFLLMI